METQTLTPVSVWRLRDQAAIKQPAVYLNYFSLRQQQQTSQIKRSVSPKKNQQQQNWFGDNTEQ